MSADRGPACRCEPGGWLVFLPSTTRLDAGDHAWIFAWRVITRRRALEDRLRHASEAEPQRLGGELQEWARRAASKVLEGGAGVVMEPVTPGA